MANIVLSTLNARYIHSSLALRYIYANLDHLQKQTKLIEFSINEDRNDVAQKILELNPQIIGLGVYIWNAKETLELVKLIRVYNPQICIVCGGPEISFYPESHPLILAVDFVIIGEADLSFPNIFVVQGYTVFLTGRT